MPIVFMDGFDAFNLTTTTLQTKGWVSNAGYANFVSTPGRNSPGLALRVSGGVNVYRPIPAANAFRIGCAARVSAFNSVKYLIGLCNAIGGAWQVGLYVENTTGKLQLYRNTTLLATSASAVPLNTWFYLEWYIVIADAISTNQSYVKINEADFFIVNSGDTKHETYDTANMLALGGGNASNVDFDDLYVSTESITTSPTFIGDHRITTLVPSANGFYSDFTGSDGNKVDNYALINSQPSGLTTSVSPTVANQKDSYRFNYVTGANPQVQAVSPNILSNKTATNRGFYRPFYRINGTEYQLQNYSPLDGYYSDSQISLTNPATGAAWTPYDIAALEAGLTLI